MVKSDKLIPVNLINIPGNSLVEFKDFCTCQLLTDNSYHSIPVKYASKLFKSIGLKDYQFVKTLYEIKPDYAVTLIREKFFSNKFKIYLSDPSSFTIFLSKEVVSGLNEFVHMSETFDQFYSFFSENRSKLVYLILDSNKSGIYAHADLINESVKLYSVKIESNMLLMYLYSEIAFTDPLFSSILHELFRSFKQTNISDMFQNLSAVKLTWSEIAKQFRLLKRKFSDSENTAVSDLNDFQKSITFSHYSIADVFNLIYESVNTPYLNYFESIYDSFIEEKLVYFLSKNF